MPRCEVLSGAHRYRHYGLTAGGIIGHLCALLDQPIPL
jgi:hypothetical protein